MAAPILATKLYIPAPRPALVQRPRLLARLNAGLAAGGKLIFISAPAGFGKTTLLSEWANQRIGESAGGKPVAWVSLDESDNDPVRFLTYFIAALQTLVPGLGAGVMDALQSPQPPPIEVLLTTLLNDIAALPELCVLVLDDYHALDSKAIDDALAFLLDHLPPHLHLVIATREDPNLPLSRLRARGQLTELRAADLRCTPEEAADFLNRVMGLSLSGEDIAALETRTEGLCIFHSWGLIFVGRYAEADLHLALVEETLGPVAETAAPAARELYGHVAATRAFLASRNQDGAGILRYGDLALTYIAPTRRAVRAYIAFFLGTGRYKENQYTLAQAARREAARLNQETGNLLVAVNSLAALAELNQIQGKLHEKCAIWG